jgi:rhamnopyranosyl-N-acetylglucosaminyl-diphospho-decaprenol beta-1,3/1,4-galactofuranosyltransferase
MVDTDRRILAVVLTHNAPGSLERCVRSIVGQASPPDALLVVDNASSPPVDGDSLPAGSIPRTVVRSETNTGPAGGWAQGLSEFLQSGLWHVWLLDDDMHPEPQCLGRLWAIADKDPGSAFVIPMSRQPDGTLSWWFSWCGLLLSRRIVETVGLPDASLFWWAEDTEYLQCRIPAHGYEPQIAYDAVVNHAGIRQGDGMPLWKYYYESRNMLYVHLYVKRRLGRYPQSVAKLFTRALFKEDGDRARRLAVMARGLADGARAKLGIRYPVEPMKERRH